MFEFFYKKEIYKTVIATGLLKSQEESVLDFSNLTKIMSAYAFEA